MNQPGEVPEELLEERAPAGTPVTKQTVENLASVWDREGTEWVPVEGGYRPRTDDPLKRDILATDVGSIPEEYQPTYGYDINVKGRPPEIPEAGPEPL